MKSSKRRPHNKHMIYVILILYYYLLLNSHNNESKKQKWFVVVIIGDHIANTRYTFLKQNTKSRSQVIYTNKELYEIFT